MDFTIEQRDYNVAEFYDHFNNDLPKVVKVTHGFYGEIVEDTFDRDQMMRIQAVSRQKRVLARMTQAHYTRLISIPLNYNEKLCVVKHNGKAGKEKDIYTIVTENTLPLTVQFPEDHSVTVGNIAISTNHIPPMELLETFEEMYLLGNFITDGVTDQEVVHVPLYLSQMRMAVATGILGQPKEKWASYREELDKACVNIEYDQQFGNPNIAEYDPSAMHSGTTYSYVEPRMYSNIVTIVRKPPTPSVDNTMYNPERNCVEEANPPAIAQNPNTAVHSVPKQPPKQNPSGDDNNGVLHGTLNLVFKEGRSLSSRLNVDHNQLKEVNSAEDVDKLSINEVGEYLKKLNLDHFVDRFKKEFVDGKLLRELDKELLESDLGMNKVEAERLTKFASTGHVPS